MKAKKFTVDVTKKDGMKSIYFVLALSLGGAENAVLKNVYNANFALASDGWPKSVIPLIYVQELWSILLLMQVLKIVCQIEISSDWRHNALYSSCSFFAFEILGMSPLILAFPNSEARRINIPKFVTTCIYLSL